MTTLRSTPVGALAGTVRVPTDKSITHRALLLAAVSDRTVTITAPLDSADTGATLSAVEACRVAVEGHLGARVVIAGRGLRGLVPSPAIDCMNAGTLMRLLPGLLVGSPLEKVGPRGCPYQMQKTAQDAVFVQARHGIQGVFNILNQLRLRLCVFESRGIEARAKQV